MHQPQPLALKRPGTTPLRLHPPPPLLHHNPPPRLRAGLPEDRHAILEYPSAAAPGAFSAPAAAALHQMNPSQTKQVSLPMAEARVIIHPNAHNLSTPLSDFGANYSLSDMAPWQRASVSQAARALLQKAKGQPSVLNRAQASQGYLRAASHRILLCIRSLLRVAMPGGSCALQRPRPCSTEWTHPENADFPL